MKPIITAPFKMRLHSSGSHVGNLSDQKDHSIFLKCELPMAALMRCL